MKQTIGNACGTIGILHAVGNNLNAINLADGSYFKQYFSKTSGMTPAERAAFLEDDDGIEAAHGSAVAAGETRCPDLDEQINLHFVALVHVDGGLYELDGRKKSPVYHGSTTSETLLSDAVPVIKTFIENSEGSINFNAIAMSSGESAF